MTYHRAILPTGRCYARDRYFSSYRKDITSKQWKTSVKNIELKVRKEQMKLVELAQESGISNGKVLKYQRTMALKIDFRRLAVEKVLNTDNILMESEEKWKTVEWLKAMILDAKNYEAKPVKRVYIPKERPLGIPTMKERCLQALINLTLEPLVEMISDRHSYGFRKYRSTKMAFAAL